MDIFCQLFIWFSESFSVFWLLSDKTFFFSFFTLEQFHKLHRNGVIFALKKFNFYLIFLFWFTCIDLHSICIHFKWFVFITEQKYKIIIRKKKQQKRNIINLERKTSKFRSICSIDTYNEQQTAEKQQYTYITFFFFFFVFFCSLYTELFSFQFSFESFSFL